MVIQVPDFIIAEEKAWTSPAAQAMLAWLKENDVQRIGTKASGYWRHEGRPGLVGGSAPSGVSLSSGYGITKGAALDRALKAGELDTPPEVKRRRYQQQNHDPAMVAYSEKVWAAEVAEMKAQGLSDDSIKKVENALNDLMRSNDRQDAKISMGAIMKASGATDAEIEAVMHEEVMSRYLDKYLEIDAAKMAFADFANNGGDPLSDEGVALYMKTESFIADYTMDEMRDAYGDSIVKQAENCIEYANYWREDYDTAENWQVAKGMAVVVQTSQALYERNAESETLYRGIYDVETNKRYTSEGIYEPVKSIADGFYQWTDKGEGSTYDEKFSDLHKEGEYDIKSDWVDGVQHVFVKEQVADVVEFRSDRLVAWSPKKQVSTTFSAGVGRSVVRKGVLSRTGVPPSEVAFYWPAIYAQLGSSIDTFEVWLYNPTGRMIVGKEEFTER